MAKRPAKKPVKKPVKIRRWRTPSMLDPGLQLAVEAAGGTMLDLSQLLEISPQALSQWKQIPVGRVIEIEQVTGIDREKLRPDLYRRRRSA